MRELLFKKLTLEDQSGRAHSYDYYVVIDEMDVGPFACESYGLRVAEEGGESASVPHITCSIARIDELCGKVTAGGVTPTTLRDVVNDWL
ncbi:MAG: DUF6514 family protein [Candidatus Enterenecus sp.]